MVAVPNKLSNGSYYRILDKNNNDITQDPKVKPELGLKIQIDVDGNGKFDDSNDITIEELEKIELFLDSKKNTKAITNIPFAEEIEDHISKNIKSMEFLDIAYNKGVEAAKIPFINVFKIGKKKELGKEAFEALKNAFEVDKSNPVSRACLCQALMELKDHFFSGMIESFLDDEGLIEGSFDKEINNLGKVIESDELDILGRMSLKDLYKETSDDSSKINQLSIEISSLKNKFPKQYQDALKIYNELTEGTESIGAEDQKVSK